MYEKETIKHIVAYLKVKIAEEVLIKTDNEYPDNPEACEQYEGACARLGAFTDVLNELEEFYVQELE